MVKRSNTSKKLFDAIKKRKYTKLHQDLENIDLHEVCYDSNTSIKTVKDIYQAYPNAALIQINGKHTPISIAVDAGFEDAVHFLANACPKSCMIRNTSGSTPLLSAIYQINHSTIIDSIINASPESAFVKDNGGDSAINLFFRLWNVCMRIVLYDQSSFDKVLDSFIGHGNWKVRDVYAKSCLFLKAASLYHKEKILNDDYLLHCALREESCHGAFCKFLIKLHPEQVLQRDSDGNLPIHIIAASKDLSDQDTFLCYDCFLNKSELVNIEFVDGSTKYCCKECFDFESSESISKAFYIRPVQKVYGMVRELLSIGPQMLLIPDNEGKYPIHIAIYNQQNCGTVYQLFRSLPCTGKIRDVETRLLPFMLAGMGHWKSEEDQITVIYQLLREDPHSIFYV